MTGDGMLFHIASKPMLCDDDVAMPSRPLIPAHGTLCLQLQNHFYLYLTAQELVLSLHSSPVATH